MFEALKRGLGLAPQTDLMTHRSPEVAVEHINKHLEYTPDNWYLSRIPQHWVFVYDGMKEGMPSNHMLGEQVMPSIQAFTKDKFSLFKTRSGASSYPIPLEKQYKNTVPFLSIRGELHLVTNDTVKSLDIYRRNGYFFTRKRVVIYVPYRPKLSRSLLGPMDVQAVKAWMYVGTESWNDLLSGYDFGVVDTYQSNKDWDTSYFPKYYNFTRKEFED